MKEALGVKYALKDTRYLVAGSDITVFSDHRPLEGIATTDPSRHEELARVAMDISKHRPEIRWISGENMKLADLLSRNFADADPLEIIYNDDD
ncbi:hypothetical protein GQ42DRAFT_129466, partial [Ramicandelaber brevisporus]